MLVEGAVRAAVDEPVGKFAMTQTVARSGDHGGLPDVYGDGWSTARAERVVEVYLGDFGRAQECPQVGGTVNHILTKRFSGIGRRRRGCLFQLADGAIRGELFIAAKFLVGSTGRLCWTSGAQ